MVLLRKCFFFDLKTGVQLLGWLFFMVTFINCYSFILIDTHEYKQTKWPVDRDPAVDLRSFLFHVRLARHIAELVASFLLVCGINLASKRLMLPWMIFNPIIFGIYASIDVFLLFSRYRIWFKMAHSDVVLRIVYELANTYTYMCIASYYQLLKETKRRPRVLQREFYMSRNPGN